MKIFMSYRRSDSADVSGRIYDRLAHKDEEGLVELTRLHLTRLDKTLAAVRQSHGDYFED